MKALKVIALALCLPVGFIAILMIVIFCAFLVIHLLDNYILPFFPWL